jgi:hypothetical protein
LDDSALNRRLARKGPFSGASPHRVEIFNRASLLYPYSESVGFRSNMKIGLPKLSEIYMSISAFSGRKSDEAKLTQQA